MSVGLTKLLERNPPRLRKRRQSRNWTTGETIDNADGNQYFTSKRRVMEFGDTTESDESAIRVTTAKPWGWVLIERSDPFRDEFMYITEKQALELASCIQEVCAHGV